MKRSGSLFAGTRFDLTGKTALITGGARGIGLETAKTLAQAGAEIILTDISGPALEEACPGFANRPRIHRLDVCDSSSIEALIRKEDIRPDILVNNAGVSRAASTKDTSDEDWRFVLSANLDGVYYCCRAFGSAMAERGSGTIVNISSMCSEIVTRQKGVAAAYNASKAAVNMITKTLACEWAGYGVRVNAIAPGFVDTGMIGTYSGDITDVWLSQTPMGRFARPNEIAPAVHFLVSDASSYITGSVLMVDGGYTCW